MIRKGVTAWPDIKLDVILDTQLTVIRLGLRCFFNGTAVIEDSIFRTDLQVQLPWSAESGDFRILQKIGRAGITPIAQTVLISAVESAGTVARFDPLIQRHCVKCEISAIGKTNHADPLFVDLRVCAEIIQTAADTADLQSSDGTPKAPQLGIDDCSIEWYVMAAHCFGFL